MMEREETRAEKLGERVMEEVKMLVESRGWEHRDEMRGKDKREEKRDKMRMAFMGGVWVRVDHNMQSLLHLTEKKNHTGT